MKLRELTVKEEKFAQVFVECGNASEAYRVAYDTTTTNQNTIWNQGHIIKKKPHVAARIKELQNESSVMSLYNAHDSIASDLNLINKYEYCLMILCDGDSGKLEVESAERTARLIGASGYNSAKERVAKMLGLFDDIEKDKFEMPLPPKKHFYDFEGDK